MYSDHFGLAQNPFTPQSTASRPFRSKELEEALAHFQYARMNRESFFLLVGEVGTGKTTAIRAIVESLGPELPVAVLSHTRLDPRELLEEVLRRFGVDNRGATSKSQLLGRLEAYLLNATEDSPAVLIVDEAHVLSHAALEELRLLSNLEREDQPLLQICLVGQPELLDRLRQHRLRPLRQRIAVRYVFGNLTRNETRDYIRHRLEAAGAAQPAGIFTDDAVDAVHSMAEGLPREINVLAGQAMLNAYLESSLVVRRSHVRTTKHDYGFEGVRVAREGEPAAPPPARAYEEIRKPPLVAPPAPAPPPPISRRTAPIEPPRTLEPATPAKPPEREPRELALQEEDDVAFLELQTSSRGWRTLLIATAVLAVGILATLAFLVYPRNLVGKAISELPPPTPPSRPSRNVPPETEIAPPSPGPESSPPTTTSPPPVPESSREEGRTEQTAVVTSVSTSAPPSIPLPREPVSRAAAAADSLERGTWLARNGSLDEAIAAFREALAIEPGYIDALYNLGSSLLEKGELSEAIEVLRRATSISPNHGLAQRSLGIALRQSGAVLEAVASLSRAVELMPNDVFALRHLASVLRESGDLEKAVEASRRAAALRPDDAGLQQELGFSLREAGHLDEATAALQRSIQIDGNLAVAHYTLGVTLLGMGNRDAGERAIAEARRLGYEPR